MGGCQLYREQNGIWRHPCLAFALQCLCSEWEYSRLYSQCCVLHKNWASLGSPQCPQSSFLQLIASLRVFVINTIFKEIILINPLIYSTPYTHTYTYMHIGVCLVLLSYVHVYVCMHTCMGKFWTLILKTCQKYQFYLF
mgnify:CR=1 FL=1